MPPREWIFRVRDILAAISAIEDYVRDMTYEQFAVDRKTREAVIYNLAVIGEAAASIPDEVQQKHPEISWDDMRRMRNVVVHIYFGVELAVVWQTIHEDLPPLVDKLRAILSVEP